MSHPICPACSSPETLAIKGDTVFMCADCGEKFIQPPPKKHPPAGKPSDKRSSG